MMRRTLVCSLLACTAFADTLVLKSGRSVEGTYLGGDSRQVRIAVGERVETYSVSELSEVRFGSAEAQPAAQPEDTPRLRRRERVEIMRPAKETPAAKTTTAKPATIPEGSNIVIRMIDDVDSDRDKLGQTYRAAIDEAVVVDGETVIVRGADVTVRLIDDKESGKLSGRTELTLDLDSIVVGGQKIDVHTQSVTTASESRTKETGKVVGGGAALGAIIGAIAGGGKGAAIGAVTGAGAGAAVQIMTKGQKVRIPSESRLTFSLQQALKL